MTPILNMDYIEASGLTNSSVNKDAGFVHYYNKSSVLKDAASRHSWTRATSISIGRAAIGGGFTFVKHPIFGKNISEKRQMEIDKIMESVYDVFFGAPERTTYIQQLAGLSAKMYYTANSFALYGQFSWEKVRDKNTGKMVSFDVLPGIVMPNVDENGKFQKPAYYFRPWNSQTVIEYKVRDLVYVANPGLDFSIFGSTDYDAISENTITSDIYASRAYKYQFENINAPYNGIWVVDPSTSAEDYADFLAMLANKYTGIEAFGSNPLVIRGQAKFEPHRSRSNDDAPYLEGRRYNQEEISAVTGVSSSKLGITDNSGKTNHRESRREFHENTLRPVFQLIEEGIYNQIMVQEFGLKEYKLAFNRPDLSTALEEATILGRYVQNGVISANEARASLGKQSRTDEYGDRFFIPSNGAWVSPTGEINSPMQESQSPSSMTANDSQVGDHLPTQEQVQVKDGGSKRQFDMQRDPNQDEVYRNKSEDVIEELKSWKAFHTRVLSGKRTDREFMTRFIDDESASMIRNNIVGMNKSEVSDFFNNIIDAVRGEFDKED